MHNNDKGKCNRFIISVTKTLSIPCCIAYFLADFFAIISQLLNVVKLRQNADVIMALVSKNISESLLHQ